MVILLNGRGTHSGKKLHRGPKSTGVQCHWGGKVGDNSVKGISSPHGLPNTKDLCISVCSSLLMTQDQLGNFPYLSRNQPNPWVSEALWEESQTSLGGVRDCRPETAGGSEAQQSHPEKAPAVVPRHQGVWDSSCSSCICNMSTFCVIPSTIFVLHWFS